MGRLSSETGKLTCIGRAIEEHAGGVVGVAVVAGLMMGACALSHPNLDITEAGPATLVRLKGTIGVVEVTAVDAELAKIAAKKPPLVILDLSGLMMIGSSAMGSLVGFRKDVTKAGGAVRMAAVPPLVRESFRRALLDKLFKTFDTVQQAIDAGTGK